MNLNRFSLDDDLKFEDFSGDDLGPGMDGNLI